MKMFRETLTFRETSRKILDIYVSAALLLKTVFCVVRLEPTKKPFNIGVAVPILTVYLYVAILYV